MRALAAAVILLASVFLWTSQVGVLRQPEMSGDILSTFLIREYVLGVYEGTRDAAWNPLLQMGYPFHAESEGALFYPVQIALYALFSLETAFILTPFVHIGGMALFAYLFFRRTGLSAGGAALAAFCFTACGFFARHHGHEWSYRTGMWFPLVLYLVHRAAAEGTRWAFPALAVAIGCQWLAGHFNFAYWTLLAATAYGFLLVWRRADGRRLALGAGFCLAFAAGLGLAAVQLLPTAELAGVSHRTEGVGWGPFAAFSFWPVHATRLLFPHVAVDLPGTANGNETDVYPGILPLVLAVVGFFFARDASARRRRWMLAGSVALVLGVFFPPNFLFYKFLPGYAAFRGPVRAIFLAAFLVAWCAGAGFDALAGATAAARRKLALGLVAFVAGSAIALLAIGALAGPLGAAGERMIALASRSGFPKSPAVHAANLRGYLAQFQENAAPDSPALWGPVALALLAAAWLVRGQGQGRFWLAFGLVCADLVLYARSLAPFALHEARFPDRFGKEIAFLKGDPEPFRIFCWPARDHIVDGIRFPGTYYFQRFGIANAASTTPRLAAVAGRDILWRTSGHAFTAGELSANLDLLGRMGVKYVLSDGPLADACLAEVFRDRLYVYRNTLFRGRVRLEGGEGSARIISETPGRVEIVAESASPVTLVLADNPYPSWEAERDGTPVTVRPGPDGIGRAVDFPSGRHTVVFRNDARADRAGGKISLLALGLVGVWFLLVSRSLGEGRG